MNSKKLTTALLVASAAFPASATALPATTTCARPSDAAIQAERAAYQDLRNPDTRGDAIAAERAGTRTCATRTRAATPSPPSAASSP